MDYNETSIDEREISIADMFLYLVKRYRSIILVGVISALIVCAGAFVKAKFFSDEEDFAAYERELTTYKADEILLDIYDKKLEETKNYLLENPLINVPDHSLPTTTISLCVEGTYAELFSNSTSYDPGDSIVNNITLAINNGMDWSDVAQKYGIDKKYIKELVNVGADYTSNIVTIYTYGETEEISQSLMEDIRTFVNDNLSSILDSYRGYYIKERNYRTYIDATWVNNIEENTRYSINNYIESIDNLTETHEDKKEPKAPDYFSVLRAIKYMIIGGVIGGVLICGIYCVMYLLSDYIRDDEELHLYFGFANLGTFSVKQNKKKANKFDNYLLKKQYGELSDDYVYERIAENINLLTKKDEKIMVSGTVDEAKLKALFDKLSSSVKSCKFVYGGNLNQDNASLAKLDEADKVILVEERNVSRTKEIVKETDLIKNCNKQVLGYITY